MKTIDNFSSTTFNYGWEQNITRNEIEGRDILISTLPRFFNEGVKVKELNNTSITDPIDLIITLDDDTKIGIEVKEWSYSCTYLGNRDNKIEPSFMLKESKLNRMKKYAKQNKIKYIIYVAILDGKAYYYYLNNINWKEVIKYNIYQKRQQMNPNSEWSYQMTYFLKLKDARKVIEKEVKE